MKAWLRDVDQWKAKSLAGFRNWPITRCFIQNDRARPIIEHTIQILPYQATLTGRAISDMIMMKIKVAANEWKYRIEIIEFKLLLNEQL